MKENNSIQAIDPAEICESNPEWSSLHSDNDWDDCRCSMVDPSESGKPHKQEKS